MTTLALSEILLEPETQLRRRAVATYCLCCGRSLADATSAAIGMGPICRKRAKIDTALKGNAQANELIALAAISAQDGDHDEVVGYMARLSALDPAFKPLARKIFRKLFSFAVEEHEDGWLIRSPYNEHVIERFKDAGLYWRPAPDRGWIAGTDADRDAALAILGKTFPRSRVLMPNGELRPLSQEAV